MHRGRGDRFADGIFVEEMRVFVRIGLFGMFGLSPLVFCWLELASRMLQGDAWPLVLEGP